LLLSQGQGTPWNLRAAAQSKGDHFLRNPGGTRCQQARCQPHDPGKSRSILIEGTRPHNVHECAGTRAHTHTHTQAQRPCTHRCTERRVGWSLAELCGLCWCQVPAVTLHCGFCFLLLQTVCCRDTRCDYGGMRSRATEPPYHSHKCMHMSFPRCVRRQGPACLHLDLAAHPCLTQGTD
jgi:hypothetical protein